MLNVSLHLHENTDCDKYGIDATIDEDGVALEFYQQMHDWKNVYTGSERVNVYMTRDIAERLQSDLAKLLKPAEVTHG